jgi:outer membrane murein-binding lipoprotein Lpp
MDIDLGIPGLTLPFRELPSFPDIVDEVKDSVAGIFSPVGNLLNSFIGGNLKKAAEPLLKELFERLKLLLKDLAFVASELLAKAEILAKSLINQILQGISGLRAEVESMVSNILIKAQDTVGQMTQKVRDNLINPFIAKVDALRKSLVQDVKEIIDQVSDAALKVINEASEVITATVDSFKNEALKYLLEFFPWDLPWDKDACRKQLNIQGVPGPELGDGELYELLKCRRLKRFDEEEEIGPLNVGVLQTLYAQLQNQAWHLACSARGSNSGIASGLKTEAIEDWIEYGKLFQLWNQFEDENMAILDALNQKVQELDTKIAQFEAKSAQLDQLSNDVQAVQSLTTAAQGTANDAVARADAAQATANNAANMQQLADVTNRLAGVENTLTATRNRLTVSHDPINASRIRSHDGKWGNWKNDAMAPPGHYVAGIRVCFEDPIDGDDTALNAVELLCVPFL